MSRKSRPSSRQPGPTENELALQWELRRMRAELTALRKEQAEWRSQHPDGSLPPPSRADLIQRLARFWRNCVFTRIAAEDRCPHCDGVTEKQVAQAYAAWAADEAKCDY